MLGQKLCASLIWTNATLKGCDSLWCYPQWLGVWIFLRCFTAVLTTFQCLSDLMGDNFQCCLNLDYSDFCGVVLTFPYLLAIWDFFLWIAQINYFSIFSTTLFPFSKIIYLSCILYILDIISLLFKTYFLQFYAGWFFCFWYFTLVLALLSYRSFSFTIVKYVLCFSCSAPVLYFA